MNVKRIVFWASFVIILALIVWGLVVAMNKAPSDGVTFGSPAPVTTADHVRGPDTAVVTLIEYSDFQCPACAIYYSVLEKLSQEASTTLRLVYRHFPLYPLPHKNAYLASQASEAAALQGKFWEMYALIFENQKAWENLADPKSVFEGYAERIGLNGAAFTRDLESGAVKDRVRADHDEAISLGINATPTFFVNGKAIVNPQSYESFKKIIDDAAIASSN